MRAPTPEEVERLQAAYGLVRAGRAHEARAAAAPIAANAPWISDAHHILGLALRALGETEAAEAAFAAAVRADSDRPEHRQEWGRALSERGHALKAQGDLEAALAAYRQAAEANPRSHVAEHNVASACRDLGRVEAAAAAAQRALAKGGQAPETFLVLGEALQALGEAEPAEAAYREAIERRTDYVEAHRALAGLVWARTADVLAALRAVESALLAFPDDTGLRSVKADILAEAGEARAAYAAAAGSSDLAALTAAAQAALAFDPKAAVDMARRAAAQADHPRTLSLLAEALLAAGEADEAAAVAEALRARNPTDQRALALQATAWRLLGDARYAALGDDDLLGAYVIDTPAGWQDLAGYLADLERSLDALHRRDASPAAPGRTGGSLLASGDRAIRAFFQAVDRPIREHVARLGSGPGPLRARGRGGYKLSGAWPVRGPVVDPVRPEGWLSGLCCIALPAEARAGEGWLAFGEPGLRTDPPLEAEHSLQPQPGLLTLFPSYMWRGAAPALGDGARLTVALDLLPA